MSSLPHISLTLRSDEVTFLMLRVLHPQYIVNSPRKLDEAAAYCVAKIQERIPLNTKISYRFGSLYKIPLKSKEIIDVGVVKELLMECLTFCHSDVEISVSATPKTIFWKLHTYNPEQEPDSITVNAVMRNLSSCSLEDKATWTDDTPTVETYKETCSFANCNTNFLADMCEFDFSQFLQSLEAKQLKLKEISHETLAKQIKINEGLRKPNLQTLPMFDSICTCSDSETQKLDGEEKSSHPPLSELLAQIEKEDRIKSWIPKDTRVPLTAPVVENVEPKESKGFDLEDPRNTNSRICNKCQEDYTDAEVEDFQEKILRYETALKMKNVERIREENKKEQEVKRECKFSLADCRLSMSETHCTDVEGKKDNKPEVTELKTSEEEQQVIQEIVQKLKAYRGKKLLRGVIKEMKGKKVKKEGKAEKKEKLEEKEVQVSQTASEATECICKCLSVEDKKKVKKDLKSTRRVSKRKTSPQTKKEKLWMASEKEIVVLSVNEPEVSNVDLDKAFEKHFEALNSTDDVVKRCQMNNQFIKSYWDLYDDQIHEIQALRTAAVQKSMTEKLTLIDQPILCIKKEAESSFSTSVPVTSCVHSKVFSVMNLGNEDLNGVELKLKSKSPWIEVESPRLETVTYDVKAGETVDIEITIRETRPESVAAFSLTHNDKEVSPKLYFTTDSWNQLGHPVQEVATTQCMEVIARAEMSLVKKQDMAVVKKIELPIARKPEMSVLPYDRLLQVLKSNMPTDPEVAGRSEVKNKIYVEEISSGTNPVYVSKLEIKLQAPEDDEDKASVCSAKEPEDDLEEEIQPEPELRQMPLVENLERPERIYPELIIREEREPDYALEDDETASDSVSENSDYEIVEEGIEANELDEEDQEEWVGVVDTTKM